MSESNTPLGALLDTSDEAVNNWLNERNQLLIQYFRLSGKRDNSYLPNEEQISQFCGLLIDYVSAGHFEVYEKIVSACEVNGEEGITLLEKLLPEISATTDIVVNFNDKYSRFAEESALQQLANDLSLLGEAIAKRVELEDNLIDTLRTKH
ncbi:sigma D regulator [Aliikangiella marina]|uniref:Sigma D regulator n=1 Tax=Aliikangiella marina TaxID=1712262 RepID=A0A545T913_9GAMM|nr:sigma D regulator [Aliikangiella marina]TQV73675.1 sigma D regulator [Aliikangiella marina]